MGSNWGIIHNQSKEEVTYMLHYQELTATEATITKELGANIKGSISGGEAGVNGKYSAEVKQMAKKVDCVYTLRPGRIMTAGLQDVDFDSIKFMTIVANGKSIMDSGRISNQDHIRIKIQPDLGMKQMSKQEATKLKEFADGTTIDNGDCPSCKVEAKCDMKEYGDKKRCNHCDQKFKELWVCRQMAQRHAYCEDCYEQLSKQKLYETKNSNKK